MVTFIILKERLNELGVTEIDGICYDLGVSSPQLENGNADFLIRKMRQDMRMNQEASTAYEVVNSYDYQGSSPYFFQTWRGQYTIARKIEQARAIKTDRNND